MTKYLATQTFRNIGIILGTIGMIYASLFAVGIAPITNSQAESMINEAVKMESMQIQNRIIRVENDLRSYNNDLVTFKDQIVRDVNTIKEQVGRIDERTLASKEFQDRILNELQRIKQELNQ